MILPITLPVADLASVAVSYARLARTAFITYSPVPIMSDLQIHVGWLVYQAWSVSYCAEYENGFPPFSRDVSAATILGVQVGVRRDFPPTAIEAVVTIHVPNFVVQAPSLAPSVDEDARSVRAPNAMSEYGSLLYDEAEAELEAMRREMER